MASNQKTSIPAVPWRTPVTDASGYVNRTWGLFFERNSSGSTSSGGLKSPLDFGGIGDGVTDDTAAVASAAALGYLFLPPGYTFVTSQVSVTAFEFWCCGGGALMLKPGSGTDLLALDGSAFTGGTYPTNGMYAHISGVTLLGNAANQPVSTGACLVLRNAAYTTVQDCLIYGATGDGIRLENYNGSYGADECNILNNRIFSNSRNGIYLLPTGSSYGHVGDHVIHANHCNYNGGSGIRGTRLTSTIIQGNNVLTNATGIYLDAADRCSILGNAVRNNKGSGVIIDQDQSGHGFGRSVQILIEANQLHYNGVQTSGDELDVWHTDGAMILGNYLGDLDFTPVAQYGIQLVSDTGIVISHNEFTATIHGPLLAPITALPVTTTIAANVSTGSQTVTPASMANITFGSQLVIANSGGSNSETVTVTWATGSDFTATFASTKTGPGITVRNIAPQHPYRSLGNINLADGMQGTRENLPSPAANDYGLTYYVTDFQHVLLWIGTQWVFQLGDSGAGWIINSVGGTITAGAWHACDGTVAKLLQGGGTTTTVTTPNLGAGYYMRI